MVLVSWPQQNFQRWYLLERTSGRSLWCRLLLLFLPSLEVFYFIALRHHPSPFRGLSPGVLHPILYFQPIPSQCDSQHFHFNFSRVFIFTASATVLSGHFFSQTRVLPYTPSFVTQVRAGTPHPGSSSVPALTELSLPADAWAWTIYVWITRPLIYQLRQWATKYRVKVELLNMFRLFKVIWKDHKNTLNKAWYTA